MPKFLVTGATGFIGRHFCRAATHAGHEVHALLQRRHNRRDYPEGTVFFGSLPYEIPSRAFEGVDAVVHCAVLTEKGSHIQEANVEGLKHIEELALRHGVKKIIFLSSQSALSSNSSDYAVTKRRSEELLRRSKLDFAILRPGLVYGPPPNGLFGRMCGMLKKLPVIPLLAGGRAVTQPIHVGDLAEAMLKAALRPGREEHNLGHPEGLALKDFLRAIASTLQRKTLFISIPLAPVETVIAIGEALRLPLPVSSDNLKGLKTVERMDTADSMAAFSIPIESVSRLAERIAEAARAKPLLSEQKPTQFALIGGGRIAIAHALSLCHQEGMRLEAVVDPSPRALAFLRSLGFETRFLPTLEEAIEKKQIDAAVIATPPHTHLALAETCWKHRIPFLLEKPIAAGRADLDRFLALHREHSDLPVAIGYQAARMKHLLEAKENLATGAWGKILHVRAACFQSHVLGQRTGRWEQSREKAGGGALINFASHLVSMVFELFGEPQSVRGRLFSMVSENLDDGADLEWVYLDRVIPFVTSWSVQGYPSPFFEIQIQTDRGRLRLGNTSYSWHASDGGVLTRTELEDPEIGYNPLPGMSGAGFALEHRDLAAAIREGRAPAMNPNVAARIDDWIYRVYETLPLEKLSDSGRSLVEKVKKWN